jgi:hypothetical protein
MATIDTPGAEHANPDDALDAQLAQLEEQLVTQYGHHGLYNEAQIRAEFQRAKHHFTHAQVRNFLPILIERAVKTALTRAR